MVFIYHAWPVFLEFIYHVWAQTDEKIIVYLFLWDDSGGTRIFLFNAMRGIPKWQWTRILWWTRILRNGDAFYGDKPYTDSPPRGYFGDLLIFRIWGWTWKRNYLAGSSRFWDGPENWRTGTSFAGTSSAGPMNQIERVQFLKSIFWSCWIGKYHNVSKDYRLRIG